MAPRIPPLFISHGSPTLYLDKGASAYSFYRQLGVRLLQEYPNLQGLLVISAHWETDSRFLVNLSPTPEQIYDFYGFPKEMYSFKYPAKGHPALAEKVIKLLQAANLPIAGDPKHGLDHGTWSPLSIVFPKAELPIVQLSLHASLDPSLHISLGKALAPLQHENILIIGSGSATHNLRDAFAGMRGEATGDSSYAFRFDKLLSDILTTKVGEEREKGLEGMGEFGEMRRAHPSTEHLAPVYVVAGAAGEHQGSKIHESMMFGALSMSCFSF